MKIINKNIQFIHFFAIILIALSVMLAMSACGNKKRGGKIVDSGVDGPYGDESNCPDCFHSKKPLVKAVGVHYLNGVQSSGSDFRVELALNIYGEKSANSAYYAGPIVADGYFYVGDIDYFCPMPIGRYRVRTVQPGVTDGMQKYKDLVVEAVHESGSPVVTLDIGGTAGFQTVSEVPALRDKEGRLYNFSIRLNVFAIELSNASNCFSQYVLTAPYQN